MNIFGKLFFSLLTLLILSALILGTFINKKFNNFYEPHFEKELKTNFIINNNNGNFTFKTYSGSLNKNEILASRINDNDIIYSYNGKIEKNTGTGGINEIKLGNGIFFFDFKNLNPNYKIYSRGFNLTPKGAGVYIINTTNPKKYVIFSLTTLIHINLENIKTQEYITSIDLFPNTYIEFKPDLNIFVKNGDLLRISKTFKLKSINEKFFTNNGINEKFLKILTLKNDDSKIILNNIVHYLDFYYKKSFKIYNQFINETFISIPGEKYINKYYLLFYNDNKKVIYYKNNLIKKFQTLIKTKTKDIKTINEIKNIFLKLKNINPKESKKILDIILYYDNINLVSNETNIYQKLNLYYLIRQLKSEKPIKIYNSLINLNNYYYNYNFFSQTDYININNFIENYLTDFNIKIDSNIQNIKQIDYLLFFMENLLIHNFNSNNIKIENIIPIFDNYVNINYYFYSNTYTKKIVTGLYINKNIISSFNKFIFNNYFLKERNKEGLLQISKTPNKTIIYIIKKDINKILNFYKNNYHNLKIGSNEQDESLNNSYIKLSKSFKEYFLALSDYEKYISVYDISKKELSENKTFNELNKKNYIFSKNNAKIFLSQFNNIGINNINITIKDYNYCKYPDNTNLIDSGINYCYEINNLYINSKKVSFLLYPLEGNKIDYLKIYDKSKSKMVNKRGSYNLDEIKEDLIKKAKNNKEDKDKYLFSNYLVKIFTKTVKNETNIYNEDTKKTNIIEDKIISVFKRNKLFGTNGDFNLIKGFISINYNDVIVKKENNKYISHIKGSTFNYSIKTKGRPLRYNGYFNANYIFTPNHNFNNISLQFIKIDEKTKKESKLLLGNLIYLDGDYKINSIKDEFDIIFKSFPKVEYITSKIGTTDLIITYIKEKNIFKFEFDYKENLVTISLSGLTSEIINMTYKNKNILEKNESYKAISKILNNLK